MAQAKQTKTRIPYNNDHGNRRKDEKRAKEHVADASISADGYAYHIYINMLLD